MKRLMTTLALAGVLLGGATVQATDAKALAERNETQEQRDARMQWFREAKFGMFIHWGTYAVAAGEWDGKEVGNCGEWIQCWRKVPAAEYAKLAARFNPVKYDAEKWVLAAKAAGMKYIVITSKHHEGFAMFKTAASPFNILDATPFGRRTGRDPLRELVAACRKHGMRIGFYYSQNLDWHHPGGGSGDWDPAHKGDPDAYVNKIVVPQVREILSNYGPVDVLWWDIPGGVINKPRADLIHKTVLELQPRIIMNNRLGGDYQGDTETPERTIPANGFPGRDWETCMTMNETWGFKKNDHSWKSTTKLLRQLVDCASMGGNYLLNVGPTAEGEIPAPSLERMAEIGKWMAVNGEAVYGSSANPFPKKPVWGRVTQKGNMLYLSVFDLPANRTLALPGLKNTIKAAWLLADKKKAKLAVTSGEAGASVTVPEGAALDPYATVIVVQLDGKPEVDAAAVTAVAQGADGALELKAGDAVIRGETAKLEDDHIGFWTNASDSVEWAFVATKPGEYEVSIEYASEAKSAGAGFEITFGDAKVSGQTVSTGSWQKFTTAAVGTVRIGKAGKTMVSVRALSKPGDGVMNLRAVTLEPVMTKETPEQKAERMKWFTDARFGMFIHWGVYSVPAGEWKGNKGHGEWFQETTHMPLSQYRLYRDQFNPVKFDADAWVKAAADAGMKYLVITSKHHDGFCLWPTKLNTDWNIAATPFKRDPLKELADACKKYGVRFCVYHSIKDWAHADWAQRRAWNDVAKGTPDMARYVEGYLKPQLKELVTQYHPGLIWFDGEWEDCWTTRQGVNVERFLRELDPALIINNRIGKSRAGTKGMDTAGIRTLGDYGTPEQQIPAAGFPKGVYWESCMTMNGHWGYNKNDHNWKSAADLIQKLVDCASKGGNYLLNVGPTAEGEIPAASLERLAEIGKWMKANGESVYETAASPFPKPFDWGRVTTKGGALYVHVFAVPADGRIVLPLKNGMKKASWLATGAAVQAASGPEGVTLTLPGTLPDKADSVIKLELDGAPVPL
jgi:alpha-L-fucosidase